MKTLLFIVLIACSLITSAQDTAAIVKATLVKTIASEADWLKARQSAQKLIADSTYSDSIFGGFMLMVGPRLWDVLKTNKELVALNFGNMMLSVPVYKNGKASGTEMVSGKITQGKSQYQALWKYLYTTFDISSGKITEMNQRDKFFCWQYFARIEEPIIIIETNKGRLMLQFSGRGLLFIESTGY